MHFSGEKTEHIHNAGSFSILDMKCNPSHPYVQKDIGELAQRKAKRTENRATFMLTLQLRSEVAEGSAAKTHKILSSVKKVNTTQKVKGAQSNYQI